jgi:hypothetical protein
MEKNHMPTIFYKGTDSNPPEDATGVAMTAETLGPALFAWLFLTTNPSWLTYITNGQAIPGTTIEDIALVLGITPGSLQFIFKLASDSAILGAMVTVANEFQAINLANLDADAYTIPCPRVADLISTLKAVIKS